MLIKVFLFRLFFANLFLGFFVLDWLFIVRIFQIFLEDFLFGFLFPVLIILARQVIAEDFQFLPLDLSIDFLSFLFLNKIRLPSVVIDFSVRFR